MKYDSGIADTFMSTFLTYLLDALGHTCNTRNKNMLCPMVSSFDFKSHYMELLPRVFVIKLIVKQIEKKNIF